MILKTSLRTLTFNMADVFYELVMFVHVLTVSLQTHGFIWVLVHSRKVDIVLPEVVSGALFREVACARLVVALICTAARGPFLRYRNHMDYLRNITLI